MKAWIGLMSGTSMDGIDAILVSFSGQTILVHATHTTTYPDDIRRRLYNLSQNRGTPDDVGELDHAVGSLFALAAKTVIDKSGFPAFHKAFFSCAGESRCILNLGGIANITHLPADTNEPITGFDTGPANALMDAWCMDQTGRAFDEDGAWAEEGEINQALLSDLLSDAYFSRQPPKSTGTEKFNLEWIKTQLRRHPDLSGADVQRTLLELTAVSVAQQLPQSPGTTIFACGGGAKNRILMRALQRTCSPARLASTDDLGLDPQWVEPAAFAWLASQTLSGKPGNVPEVTGAEGKRILGAVYYA